MFYAQVVLFESTTDNTMLMLYKTILN